MTPETCYAKAEQMPQSNSNICCAHCGRIVCKHDLIDDRRRVLLVSEGKFTGQTQTFETVRLVCEGKCDRGLRSSASLFDDDFDLSSNQPVPFEEWEALNDAVSYHHEWLTKWRSHIKAGVVAAECIPILRAVAMLLNQVAGDVNTVEKNRSLQA